MTGALTVLALAALVTASPIPQPRPADLVPTEVIVEAPADPAADAPELETPVPVPRPNALALALRTTPNPPPALPPDRMACRDPRLEGTDKASFRNMFGCGVFDPVNITRVAGIKLSTPATLTCPTARALADWLTGVADPTAREMLGERIKGVWVMGTYTCRTRNSRPGARLSEHAFGRAVDIGGFTLGSGRKVVVRTGWGKGAEGGFLRRIRERACGRFKTVLGPGSDRHHHDHLHLDLANRKSTYCR